MILLREVPTTLLTILTPASGPSQLSGITRAPCFLRGHLHSAWEDCCACFRILSDIL